MRPLALVVLLLGVAAAAPDAVGLTLPVNASASSTPLARRTDPFTAVRVETPFNVRIEPGKAHGVALEADPAVVSAVGYKVEGEVLTVTTDNTFKTDHPIKLVIQ